MYRGARYTACGSARAFRLCSRQEATKDMTGRASVQYQVTFAKDPATGNVVAEVPALRIADFGVDTPEALDRLKAMVTFHLDCLREEGKTIPLDEGEEAGFYLRVNLPSHAA